MDSFYCAGPRTAQGQPGNESGYAIAMNWPLYSFALGILLLQQQPALPPWPWLPLGAAAVLGLLALGRRPGALPRLGTILLAAALGFLWAGWRAETRLAERLAPALEGQDLQLQGRIAALPQDFGRGQRFEFAVAPGAGVSLPPTLLLSWYDRPETPRPRLEPGQEWQLTVRLKRPHGHANGAGFDYEAWLLERGIGATGYVREAADNRLLGRSDGFFSRIERLRQAVREDFQARLPEADYPYAGILTALAVGDQKAIPGDQWKVFAGTGTTHLMSISGLHVTMMAALAAALAGGLWRRSPALMARWPAQRAALLAGWLAAAGYTLLAGAGVPALRTLAMLGAAALALASGRRVAPGNVLAFALLAVLLPDPWAVLAPGFWLSFVAVGALLLAARPLAEEPPRQSWRRRLGRHLGHWSLTQWVATLGTLPLLLLFFQQFSLVSPLANALAIPLVSLAVTPLALAAALLPLPGLAAAAHALLHGLMLCLQWLAALPGALWTPPAPTLPALFLAALGCVCVLLPRGFPGRWLGLLMLLPLLATPQPRPPPGQAWVTLLDVGQGLAVAVRTQKHTLLYDAGPYYSPESDAGERLVLPWLRSVGVDRLDTLVVTHRDWDHSGGARSVLESLPVALLLDSLPPASPEARDLQPLAQERRACAEGQGWEWDGVRFSMLHPPAGRVDAPQGRSNHQSCVLLVQAAGQRLLLSADIEAADEAWLLARHRTELASQVLLVPHHGSRSSSTAPFVAAVGAREVLYPVGYRNRFGHPRPEVVERYAASGARAWRTDRDGAIGLVLGAATANGKPELWAERQRRPRYWYDRYAWKESGQGGPDEEENGNDSKAPAPTTTAPQGR